MFFEHPQCVKQNEKHVWSITSLNTFILEANIVFTHEDFKVHEGEVSC